MWAGVLLLLLKTPLTLGALVAAVCDNDTALGARRRLIHTSHVTACIRLAGIDFAPVIRLCSGARDLC